VAASCGPPAAKHDRSGDDLVVGGGDRPPAVGRGDREDRLVLDQLGTGVPGGDGEAVDELLPSAVEVGDPTGCELPEHRSRRKHSGAC
jgi:hypothetical protein